MSPLECYWTCANQLKGRIKLLINRLISSSWGNCWVWKWTVSTAVGWESNAELHQLQTSPHTELETTGGFPDCFSALNIIVEQNGKYYSVQPFWGFIWTFYDTNEPCAHVWWTSTFLKFTVFCLFVRNIMLIFMILYLCGFLFGLVTCSAPDRF